MSNKYTAIIIEPRKHKAISFVLQNFLENLDNDWKFLFFHGTENKEYVENIINTNLEVYKDRIKLINLNVANLFSKEYSKLIKDKNFYDYIDTETFLIFQTDTLILKENKHLIYNFLEYDYVGAPWKDSVVGNGGLSLRKKSKMLEIIASYDDIENNNQNEDEFFCLQHNIELIRPSFAKAKEFSVETIFYISPFGVHNFYSHLSNKECKLLIDKYPDLKTIRSLNIIDTCPYINKFTIIYKIYLLDLKLLKESLLSLIKYQNPDIFEIIIYCHDIIRDDVYKLFEILQIKSFFKYKIIPLGHNYYGHLKQSVALAECYNDCLTEYIVFIDNNFVLNEDLDLSKSIRKNNKIEWKYKKQQKNNIYDNNILIVTKKSLQEASNKFKQSYNCDYDNYCQNRLGTEGIRVEDNLYEVHDKINKIFNVIEYIGFYCQNFSDEYIFTSID